jgi:hypothetical protein
MASINKKINLEHLQECSFCGVQKKGLLACARCKTTSYCDRDCQLAHWKAPAGHKGFCILVKDRAPGVSSTTTRKLFVNQIHTRQ